MQYSPEEIKKIKKDLTVVLKSDYGPSKTLTFYKNDGRLPYVWATDNIHSYTAPVFKSIKIQQMNHNITLRPLQIECMKCIDSEFKKEVGGGIINLATGSGKTIISICTIAKYRYKTLIIVNTVELMNQWKESIKNFLGDIPIGIIRGDSFDTDAPITIGMIQTISRRNEYTQKMFSCFSLCFIDECHHLSSEVFSEALFKCRTKYTFGLSATVERKDGLEFVFKYHIGNIIFTDRDSRSSKQKSIIKKIEYKGASSVAKYLFNGKPKISTMITNIALDIERNRMIADTIISLDASRYILVLSDRIEQLKTLHKMLGSNVSGIFIGKTTKEDKQISKSKRVLLATYNIASEGFDHPILNTLLFATPRTNVIQAIGRIYRKIHTVEPMIIDIVDNFSMFPHQYNARSVIYRKHLNTSYANNSTIDENVCLFD